MCFPTPGPSQKPTTTMTTTKRGFRKQNTACFYRGPLASIVDLNAVVLAVITVSQALPPGSFTVSSLFAFRAALAGRGGVFYCRHLSTLPRRTELPFLTQNIFPATQQMGDDIEDLHQLALRQGSTTYIDPATGFTCFTELEHLRRGKCCGNRCRHCPYGWSNVQTGEKRQGKLESGDMEAAERLVREIESNSQQEEPATPNIETCLEQPQRTSGKGGRHGGQYTKKNVPYTRKGDQGTSQLLTGERRSKADDAFEAMGTVDELCTVVGVAHAELLSVDSNIYGELPEWLLDVMSRLFDLGSHVAKPNKDGTFDADGVGGGFHQSHVDQLEDWIDFMTDELPELNSFILPTGGKAAAQLHVARTVCRRAERRVVELVNYQVCDPNGMRYLNRLSDFFFTAARWVNFREGKGEIQYRRDYRGAKQRSRRTVSLNNEAEDTSKS